MGKLKYFWILHILVFFTSAVPLLVINISLSPFAIAFQRTFLAVLFIFLVAYYKREKLRVENKNFVRYIASGIFMAVYWVSLIYCAKKSNASVTLVGMATSPLWVSFLSPLLGNEQLSFHKVLIGLSALFGIYMIFNSGFTHQMGLAIAIGCGFMSALLNIINAKLATKGNTLQLAFYQTAGALTGTFLMALLSGNLQALTERPTLYDFAMILGIAFLFSVVSYLLLLHIYNKISVFNISLAFNLTPVYGSLIGLLISWQTETMNIYFYGGAIIIVFSVFVYPIVKFIYRNSESRSVVEPVGE